MPRLTPDQQQLVEKYKHVPYQVTVQAFRTGRIAGFADFEEVQSYLTEEFCRCALRWNGDGSFSGYAKFRLQHAITDYIRETGPRTRGGKDRIKSSLWIEDGEGEDKVPTENSMREEDREPGFEEEYLGTEFLTYALDKVSERERSVLWMRYVEGLTLKQIGEVLGVTEGRISQIESKALSKLRGDPDVVRTAASLQG